MCQPGASESSGLAEHSRGTDTFWIATGSLPEWVPGGPLPRVVSEGDIGGGAAGAAAALHDGVHMVVEPQWVGSA